MQCINRLWLCDGDVDCFDESDEENCKKEEVQCEDDKHLCSNGKQCIEKNQVCDGFENCDDGSDEHNCEAFKTKGRKVFVNF